MRMERPIERAASGSFLAPKSTMISRTMIPISHGPRDMWLLQIHVVQAKPQTTVVAGRLYGSIIVAFTVRQHYTLTNHAQPFGLWIPEDQLALCF